MSFSSCLPQQPSQSFDAKQESASQSSEDIMQASSPPPPLHTSVFSPHLRWYASPLEGCRTLEVPSYCGKVYLSLPDPGRVVKQYSLPLYVSKTASVAESWRKLLAIYPLIESAKFVEESGPYLMPQSIDALVSSVESQIAPIVFSVSHSQLRTLSVLKTKCWILLLFSSLCVLSLAFWNLLQLETERPWVTCIPSLLLFLGAAIAVLFLNSKMRKKYREIALLLEEASQQPMSSQSMGLAVQAVGPFILQVIRPK